MKLQQIFFPLGAALMLTTTNAALLSINYSGNQELAGWGDPGGPALNSSNYSSTTYGMATNWVMASSYGNAAANSSLNKLSGGFYPASASLYSFGSDSNFSARNNASTLTSLKTVVFQSETVVNPEIPFAAPTLSYNGGTQNLVATFSHVAPSGGFIDFGGSAVPLNNWAWQWDLSGVTDPITAYQVNWTQIVHASLVRLELSGSDAIHNASLVPEPGSMSLLGMPLLILLRRRRA